MPVRGRYGPEEVDGIEYERDLADPGSYPFTRGIHPDMYRAKLWTMRQFAGFGTPEETNQRFRYLLKQGQTGLSTAFDMPTLMGLDPDDPRSLGEVGREGVSVATLADMQTLFRAIPLGNVTTSMTINGPALILLGLYAVTGEQQGIETKALSGTIQTDILKEYIAQKEWLFPPEPSMRVVVDMFQWCAEAMPRWNPISISGYHIREAGATAVQELAFTLADGIAYVQAAVERGLDVDLFAPRLSFFFDAQSDFFEEIAKFRAARRIWARLMRERFGAKNERSWKLRFHAQTAGVSLTAQQPLNNVVRTTLQALAAVLGGAQSLHTNSLDETYALPTEEAVTLALRTQQILAEETGIPSTPDPLGGSYFLEHLTTEVEAHALDYIHKIDDMGGMIRAIESGFPQREIGRSAFEVQQAIERGERTLVGVNRYQLPEERPIPILKIRPEVEETQVARVRRVREDRSAEGVRRALDGLRRTAEGTENLMSSVFECARASVTLGEMCAALKSVFGEYREPALF